MKVILNGLGNIEVDISQVKNAVLKRVLAKRCCSTGFQFWGGKSTHTDSDKPYEDHSDHTEYNKHIDTNFNRDYYGDHTDKEVNTRHYRD